ncbi:MAG: RdgB/HAM1 family non-canonical purine NTP pyrophosphatase [Acidobacteria bacterium]|nr:RdgB/HAM1 family non-canonical purine NTP pyrophosphatase [Acidobacteriota bacterium]
MNRQQESFGVPPSALRLTGKCPVLLIASSNPGKITEFRLGVRLWVEKIAARGITQPPKWNVQPVPGIETLPTCMEDGESFSENAVKKALHYSRFASGIVLADDSGLEVDALGGAPGVRSRRYAGLGATDARNNAKLLEEMRGVPSAERGAQFVCVLALTRSGQQVVEFRGEVRGVLLESPRGDNGFGYDPLFVLPELNRTFAELSTEEKLSRSHRGKALQAMLEWQAKNSQWFRGER